MKLKFSLIVALCALMGFVACGKGNKNSSAKIRNANQENSINNLNAGKDLAKTGEVDITLSPEAAAKVKEDEAKRKAAENTASAEYSKEELFSADIKVTGFDSEDKGIIQNLNAVQVEPVKNVTECKVVAKVSSNIKTVEATIRGTSEEEITTFLKVTFNVDATDEAVKNSEIEITTLKIRAKKEGKQVTLVDVSKYLNNENAVSYSLLNIDPSKLKKNGEYTKRLKADIRATKIKDKNDKDVTVAGEIQCALDLTE